MTDRSFEEQVERVAARRAQLISRCAADIEPKRIDFLWPGRIARGKHTAIAGEPGDGKSQISVYIAAAISQGGAWPCGEGTAPVGNVIILNAEDGADDTVIPRLLAAGADLERVHIVSAVLQEDGKGRRTFNLQADLALLERELTRIGNVALVIIDPISSYMGKADSHKNAEVRGALEPLSEMAERLKVAILSITHFSKTGAGNNSKALHRFIGSIAFVGAPRAAFAVIEDADSEGRILFLHAKNNMAGKPQGLAYRLEQRIVGEEGAGIVASYVAWDNEPVIVSADEALRASDGNGDRTAAAEAEEFLQDKLAGGEVPAKDAEEHGHALGILPRTLRRARKKLGVVARRESEGRDGRGQWLWSLPSDLQGGQESCKAAKESNGPLAPNLAALQKSQPGAAGPKVLKSSYEAHVLNVSTLGKNEHLKDEGFGSAPPSQIASEPGLCVQCAGVTGDPPELCRGSGYPQEGVWLHRECVRHWVKEQEHPAADLWQDLDIPPFLRRDLQ